jgi:hypothetical protein
VQLIVDIFELTLPKKMQFPVPFLQARRERGQLKFVASELQIYRPKFWTGPMLDSMWHMVGLKDS